VRDQCPWLYELALELYRAMNRDDTTAVERTRNALTMALKTVTHGPFMFEMIGGPEDEEMFMFLRYLTDDLVHVLTKPKRVQKLEQSQKEKA
jgi:hypothetical protein